MYQLRCPAPHPDRDRTGSPHRGRGCNDLLNIRAEPWRWTGRISPRFEDLCQGDAALVAFRCPRCNALSEWRPVESEAEIAPGLRRTDLTALQAELLALLAVRGNVSTKSLLARLKTPRPARTVRHDLGRLVEAGLVERRGRTKRVRWVLAGSLPKLPNLAESNRRGA